jgi:anti-sigma factor RsiW
VLLKRTASGSDMQAAGTAAPPRAPPPAAAAAAAVGRGNPAKRGRLVSNGLSCGGGTGQQAAAIAAAAGAAAGSMIPGVDYDALQQLSNTQAAQQLGASGGNALMGPGSWECWQCLWRVRYHQ